MTSFGVDGETTRPDTFNRTRWLRVGAGPRQIVKLEEAFNALSYEDRVATNLRMASMPDGELSASLPNLPGVPDVVQAAQPPENSTDAGTLPPGSAPGDPVASD